MVIYSFIFVRSSMHRFSPSIVRIALYFCCDDNTTVLEYDLDKKNLSAFDLPIITSMLCKGPNFVFGQRLVLTDMRDSMGTSKSN
jgi:hypothetical protein